MIRQAAVLALRGVVLLSSAYLVTVMLDDMRQVDKWIREW